MNGSKNGSDDARTRSRREAQNEAEFGLGYLYATIENNINTYATQTGYTYSVANVAFRLGRLLTSKALRQEPGLAQLVSEMREEHSPALLGAGDQRDGHEFAAEAEVHVRPRVGRPLGSKNKVRELGRPLTPEERRANWRLDAQQRRNAQLAAGLNSSGKPYKHASGLDKWGNKRKVSPKQLAAMRANAIKARAAYKTKHRGPGTFTRKSSSATLKSYWAKMTPEQRSAEMARRIALSKSKREARSA